MKLVDDLQAAKPNWRQAYTDTPGGLAMLGAIAVFFGFAERLLGGQGDDVIGALGIALLVGAYVERDRLVSVPIWGLFAKGELVDVYVYRRQQVGSRYGSARGMLSHWKTEKPGKRYELRQLGWHNVYVTRRELEGLGEWFLDGEAGVLGESGSGEP